MAHKLEVLKPRAGAVAAPPRVLADASLALSFQLPAGFSRCPPPARASRPPPARASRPPLASSSSSTAPEAQRDAFSSDGEDESWETRDFNTGLAAAAGRNEDAEVGELEEATTVAAEATAALEIGAWEEQDAPELPDDFPLLLVNLTRLQREHFPPEPTKTPLSADDTRQLFELVKQTLHRHFTQMVEVLFEQKSCFHCTYGTSRAMLANLHAAYPDDVFGLVDYPTEIQGIELSEFLHVLSRPSRWKSVDYLKDCLRRCSRDIKWKFDVALELDVLAEKEYEIYTTGQDRLSAEIDDLTRLRDSFKDKLAKLAAKEGTGAKTKSSSQEYLLLRKLEDIETRLVSLLDTYLEEPELQEHECEGMFEGGAHSLTAGMNVLDMVVAMIFSRLPRDFSQQLTSEEHFQMLFDHHIHIRRLWKRDFGRLPPRTNASAYADSDEEEEKEEKTEEVVESQRMYENDGHYDDDDDDADDYRERYQEKCVGADGEENEDDDFQHYESVEIPPVTSTSHDAVSSSGSWESVHADEIRDDSVRIEMSGDEADREDSKSDGYGADYDSDESEDEPPAVERTPSRSPRSAVTGGQTKPVRRVRVRKTLQPTTETLVDDGEQAVSQLEGAKKSKSSKKKKKDKAKSKSRSKKSKAKDEHEEPFRPFACTGALSLLRLAKENELF